MEMLIYHNKNQNTPRYSAGYFDGGTTFFQLRGEFCVAYTVGVCHGYSISGLYMPDHTHVKCQPQSDFQTFIREISDTGASTFTRPFTPKEKSYLTLKFGFPCLPQDIVLEYYKKVLKMHHTHPYNPIDINMEN